MARKAVLRGALEMDNSSFAKTMRASQKLANETSHSIKDSFREIAAPLAAGLSIAGIVEGAHSLMEFSHNLVDTSERLNINVESLQKLQYAFMQGGASAEDFDKSMLKLNEHIADVRNGNMDALKSFNALGISLADVKYASPEKVLLMIANGMRDADDPTVALSAAMDLLGKSGAHLIPVMREGSDAIQDLGMSARVATEDAVRRFEHADQAIGNFWHELKATAVDTIGALVELWDEYFNKIDERQKKNAGAFTIGNPQNLSPVDLTGTGLDYNQPKKGKLNENTDVEDDSKSIMEESVKLGKLSVEVYAERLAIAREAMTEEQRINSLIKEREKLIGNIGFFNKTQEVEQLANELEILKLTREIEERKRRLPKKEAAKTVAASAMVVHQMEIGGNRLLFGKGLGGSPHHPVRHGDRARAKAAAKEAADREKENKSAITDPIVSAINDPRWAKPTK